MKRIALAAVASCLALSAFASTDSTSKDKFKLIHVADLAAALKSPTPPVVCDANNKDVRAQYGTIPGAILLSNYKRYNVAKTLPADKATPLVFYCANTMCMASHGAAQRAVKAGYTNVSVMADGIFGWVKAGQPVSKRKS